MQQVGPITARGNYLQCHRLSKGDLVSCAAGKIEGKICLVTLGIILSIAHFSQEFEHTYQ